MEVQKFGEYTQDLLVPTNINLIRVKPLRGTGLLVIEAPLLFAIVDNYFGGNGRFHTKIEGREFTPTEMRVVQIVLDQVFAVMSESWQPVMRLDFEYLNSEVNPHFANIVAPSEPVVVSRFHIEIEGLGGDIHLTLPYAMIEPIREALNSGIASDRGPSDNRFSEALLEQVRDCTLDVRSVMCEAQMSIADLMRMKPGDVIPVRMPDTVDLIVDDMPAFRGTFGTNAGRNAVKVTGAHRPPNNDSKH